MSTNFNIGFLKTVREPILESLKEALLNLDENVLFNKKEISKNQIGTLNINIIDLTTGSIHKTLGALKMIGLDGLVVLCDAVEISLKAIKNDNYASSTNLLSKETIQEIIASSKETVNNIVFYIEQLLNGELDQPLKLYNNYNKLFSLLNQPTTKKDLFFPKLDFIANEYTSNLTKEIKNKPLLNKDESNILVNNMSNWKLASQKLMTEIFTLIDKPDIKKAILFKDKTSELKVILNKISSLKLSKNYFILAHLQMVFLDIVDYIFVTDANLLSKESKSIKLNLSKIEKEIRSFYTLLADYVKLENFGSIKNLTLKIDNETTKDVVFFIVNYLAYLKENDISLTQIKNIYNLDFYIKSLNEAELFVSMTQKNPELVTNLEKAFIELKEEVVILTSKQNLSKELLNQHFSKIVSNSNKLNELAKTLNLQFILEINAAAVKVFQSVKNSSLAYSEKVQEEISIYIIFLDNAINNIIKTANLENLEKTDFKNQVTILINRLNLLSRNELKELDGLDSPILDNYSKEKDEKKAFKKVYEELYNDLLIVEEAVDQFFRSNGETIEDLKLIIPSLKNARGVLNITQNPELAKTVKYIDNIFTIVTNNGKDAVTEDQLKNSANGLGGVLLYINAYKDDNYEEANSILDSIKLLLIQIEEKKTPSAKLDFEPVVSNNDIAKEKEIILEENVVESNLPSLPSIEHNTLNEEELVFHNTESVFTNVEHNISLNNSNDIGDWDHSNDQELCDIFLIESEEVLETIEIILPKLENDLENKELSTELRRAFHTLKGSGRMVDLIYIGECAWLVEQTLNTYLNNNTTLTQELIDVLKTVTTKLSSWIKVLSEDKKVLVDTNSIYKLLKDINPHVNLSIDINNNIESEPVANANIDIKKDVNESLSQLKKLGEIKDSKEVEESFYNDKSITLESLPEVKNIELNHELHIEVLEIEEPKLVPMLELKEETILVEELTLNPNLEEEQKELVLELNNDFNINILDNNEMIEQPVTEKMIVTESKLELSKEEELYLNNIQNTMLIKNEELVNINGKEISGNLFELFQSESEQHINNMSNYLKDIEESYASMLSDDFLRYSHTLSSISKTVNLLKLAELSSQIELISKLATEKEIKLNRQNINDLSLVVSNLNMFKNQTIDNSLEDVFYEQSKILNRLEEALSNNNVANQIEKTDEKNYISNNDLETILNNLADKMTSIIKERDIQLTNKFDELTKRLEDVSNKENGEVINQEIENKFTKLKDEITSVEDSNKLVKDSMEKLVQFVNEDLINKVKEITQTNQKETSKMFATLRKEIIEVKDEVKKKSGEFNKDFLEESLDEEKETLIDLKDNLLISPFESGINSITNNSVNQQFLNDHSFVAEIYSDKISNIDDDFDQEIFEIASQEIEDILQNIDSLRVTISEKFDIEQNNQLKRYLHTLKGSARMVGANKVGLIAHRLESLIEYTENHQISLEEIESILDLEVNKINFLLDNKNKVFSTEKKLWLDSMFFKNETSIKSDIPFFEVETINNNNNNSITTFPEIIQKQFVRVDAKVLDSLVNEAGEIRLTRSNLEGTVEGYKKIIIDLKSSSSKLKEVVKEIEIQAETQMQASKDKKIEFGEDFDPLEFDRFTRLQELTRFMSEDSQDIADAITSIEIINKKEDEVINQQNVLTTGILNDLMKIRLVTLNTISDRLYKVTKQSSKDVGKQAKLELVGENTEIDRLVLEKITISLEHLIRNSIAHGIEFPIDRANKSKNVIGTIKVESKLEDNFIQLIVSDDGAGINIEKVKQIAINKGIYNFNKEYTKKELIDFIFESGFSTANEISQVSGRGVGMDIVHSEITSLGGSITVNTNENIGTEFIITLPVAVATSQALLVDVSGHLLAIPAILVEEIISYKKDRIALIYENMSINLYDKKVPFSYLGHLMGGPLPLTSQPEFKVYNTVIVINYNNEKIAVHVDKLINTSDILIKNVGSQLSKISGIIGATILGDGRQGFIVNPLLLKQHFDKYILPSVTNLELNKINIGKNEVVTKNRFDKKIIVLVVDDSLTVRKTTEKVLKNNNYEVILAKHGEDALEKLQVQIPDIIISDIEMPVMDGFDFTKNLKNSSLFKEIPIIMITSRTADKHKNYAMSLGVDRFLGKPYKEEELISSIKSLVNKN